MATRLNDPDPPDINARRRKPLPTSNAFSIPWSSIRALDGSWKARRNAQVALQQSASERFEQLLAIDRFEQAHARQSLVDLLAVSRRER
jgi:hypothetical protein